MEQIDLIESLAFFRVANFDNNPIINLVEYLVLSDRSNKSAKEKILDAVKYIIERKETIKLTNPTINFNIFLPKEFNATTEAI